MSKKKPMIYIAGPEEKEKAIKICDEFIKKLENEEIQFMAYVLQMLLESFEESFDIDIRNGMSFHQQD